jgi:uncharacterized phage protein (TIGR01671 family)
MREIKFRGKGINSSKWYTGALYVFKDHAWVLEVTPSKNGSTGYAYCGKSPIEIFGAHNVEIETIGQFTGLKGKNGKEIYEGDIVEYDDFYVGDKLFPKGKDVVYFEDGCYFGGDGELDEVSIDIRKIKVIGNIHENPELLKD